MPEDLPFLAQYAKTGRAGCKGCKSPIAQGSLRLAVMVQSPHFDGKVPTWFHYACFWKRTRVQKSDDIEGFHSLRWEDQQKIEKAIENGGSGNSGKSKEGENAASDNSDPATKDYKVEYAKSGGSKCRSCEDKIPKAAVRIGKMDYESEQAKIYGPQTRWHHVQCFMDNRIELCFSTDLSIETCSGFSSLEEDDKKRLVTLLGKGEARPKNSTDGSEPANRKSKGKKRKKESKLEDDENKSENSIELDAKKLKEDLQEKLKTQSKLIWKVRDQIEMEGSLTNRDMKELLELNDQDVPETGRLVERLADSLVFGALELCPECKNGHLVISEGCNAYKCLGQVTEWAKCEYKTKTPKRRPLEFPDDLKECVTIFKKYKYKPKERIFPPDRVSTVEVAKKETETTVNEHSKPLSNLKFAVAGKMEKPLRGLKQALLELGATVATEVDGTVVALIASASELKKGLSKSKYLTAAETADVDVVREDFIAALSEAAGDKRLQISLTQDTKPSVSDGFIELTDLIAKHRAISEWGGSADSRIRLNLAKSRGLMSKSGTKSTLKSESFKSDVKTKKFKVKGRSAVDPDSGLEDKAHVLEEGSTIWSCVLNLVSVTSGTNSYYRLQLLEKDNGSTWWIFRAWGRIGTTVGGNKVEKYKNKKEAKSAFKFLFHDKTGNEWNKGKYSDQKVPGKFYPVEVNFGVDPDEQADKLSLKNAGGKSKLPEQVKDLVKLIFDVKMMKLIMAEMEIDLKKMPLGRISKSQIQKAYGVLTELQNAIESGNNDKYVFVDASNRFYSLIPHDFGMEAPRRIDTLDAVKDKTTMLDELMQIELAYRMLSDSTSGEAEDPLDVHYKQLNTEIIPLERGTDEFKLLERYVKNTHASTHSQYKLVIHDIFRIDREEEVERFKPFHTMPNHKLLWHGSRLTNYAGILSQGLRIAPPEAPATGYMFGKGIYFADMVSKSANYCYASAANNTGLVMLADVALGMEHEIVQAQGFKKPPSGYDSVKGVGMTCPDPSGKVTLPVSDKGYEVEIPCGKQTMSAVKKSSLLYNEFIVYDIAQVRLRYLFRMEFRYNI